MRPTGRGILVIITVILMFFSVLLQLSGKNEEDSQNKTPEEKKSDDIIIETETKELYISLYNHWNKRLETLTLEDYLIGVVAGEMPASYGMEALKAQAVAARTLAVYQMPAYGGKGCSQHENADVCSSFAHCQEWITQNQMRKNWGSDFDEYFRRIQQAVEETRGEIMTYEGRPIEVFYHSTSNGRTEDVSEVFSNSLPYYSSVESYGDENTSRFEGKVTLTNQKFADIFYSKYEIKLNPKKLSSQIKINGYTKSGRIKEITVGGKKLRATEFRLLYGLNSTDITFEFGDDTITMKTKGFGHGVGMSQAGANYMAGQGYTYKDILKHYYTGVLISRY